jgi:small-conductance mechanosensitive channel
MSERTESLGILRNLELNDLALVAGAVVLAWLLASAVRWVLGNLAERSPPRLRLTILRVIPLLRLGVGIAALTVIVPVLIEPTFQNVVAMVASLGLALAFVLKEYASSLVAGVVTVLEGPYQPGDWIKVGDTYGEVKLIGVRAVHIVTAEDNEVIIPHSRLWSSSISNATSGGRSVLCIADFYLHPDHDAGAARRRLAQVAETSGYLKAETQVSVVVHEKPWGTHYKLKAYAKESREQFNFVTDLTVRGKEALRAMNLRFAQAPYAEAGQG